MAERLDDEVLLARALRMHGNELSKADHVRAAVAHLGRAVAASADAEGRGAALALLARAAGELGDPVLFDRAISGYRDLLDGVAARDVLVNPFTFTEIHLRGLVSTGYVIERVTAAQVLLAVWSR